MQASPVPAAASILTVNAGSSSIRFTVYEVGARPKLRLDGKIHRIGLSGTHLTANDAAGLPHASHRLTVSDRRAIEGFLLGWLEAQPVFASVKAVGHRVVFGMRHSEPERVTPKLMKELHRIASCDPEHMPREIRLIEAFSRRHPGLSQVACFDTAFHRSMPLVAKLLPIPRRYAAKGIERYGFHGLSYAYLMEELARLDPAATQGRIILAHLGSGASMVAVSHGSSIDTSMGFTAAAGLVMGTRTGDLDPGLAYYLARVERKSAAGFQRMVNHQSGLLGVSGTSSDMRELLEHEAQDPRAAEAVALFCYQAKKWIGSFAAALGGLDTLIFAGGIGENAPLIRERICSGLGFLGIEFDQTRNTDGATLISPDDGHVKVRVMRTDEELMIARSVARLLDLGQARATGP